MQKRLRVLIVFVVAAGVALLPLAGGPVFAPSASTAEAASPMADHGDCCDHGGPCDTKKAGGCGSTAGCMVKCSAMSGPVLATSVVDAAPDGESSHLVVQRLASIGDNPPSPPPRA